MPRTRNYPAWQSGLQALEDLRRGRDVAKQQNQNKPKNMFSLLWMAPHRGIPGFEGLGFNLLSNICVSLSQVRFIVSNFWCIFHPDKVNFVSQPQLLNIPTPQKTGFQLSVLIKQNWRNTRRKFWGGKRRFLILVCSQQQSSMSLNDVEQKWMLEVDCYSRLHLIASSTYYSYNQKTWTVG